MILSRALWVIPALALCACGESSPETQAEAAAVAALRGEPTPQTPTPAAAAAPAIPTGPMSAEASDLADCIGVIAAVGGIELSSTRNDASSPAFQEYVAMQMAVGGLSERPAPGAMSAQVKARKAYWTERPQAERNTRAQACADKY